MESKQLTPCLKIGLSSYLISICCYYTIFNLKLYLLCRFFYSRQPIYAAVAVAHGLKIVGAKLNF